MGSLPNPSTTPVAIALALAVAVVLAGFGVLTWRATLPVKLGLRNIPRRRARAALILLGLTLSTTVIGAALGTGDTMDYTVRSLVTRSLGPVDEVIALDPPPGGIRDEARALTEPGLGSLAADDLGFFDQGMVDRLAGTGGGDIEGLAPAIVQEVSGINPAARQVRSSVLLLAMPLPYPRGFDTPRALDGAPLRLDALGRDDVILNAAAAQLFGISAGQPLRILTGGQTWDARVAAVVQNGGLGGMQASVIAALPRYQQVIGQPDQVNAVLVANRGGVNSVTHGAAASQALRLRLADREAAQRLHDFLARPEIQRALLSAKEDLPADSRAAVDALRSEATRPELTDRFISLITDPPTRRELFLLARSLPAGRERWQTYGWLVRVTMLSVVEVKQAAIDQADQIGSVVSTVFLVLGIFSVAAASLLIFLIFSLLAADRGPDLATMRALGMSRRQIIAMFLAEGLIYDLAAAAAGAALGVAGTLATTTLISRSLALFGFGIAWHIEPRSVLIAFAAGALLTFGTMAAAAWRVSRGEIVAATRGMLVDESRAWLIVPGLLLLLSAGFVWWRWRVPPAIYEPRYPLVVPGALTLALLGGAVAVQGAVGARHASPLLGSRLSWSAARRAEALAGGCATALGFGLVAVWVRTLMRLPTAGGDTRADAVTVAVAGLVLVLAATWGLTRVLGPLLQVLDRAFAGLARLRVVVRPAAGALGHQRGRSGLAVVMFGVVVFTLVVSLTLIDALASAYGGGEPPIAGFQIRADQQGGAPIGGIDQALARAGTISRDAFSAIGAVSRFDVQVVQLGTASAAWSGAELAAVDDGFLSAIQARMARHAEGISDAEVWTTLRARTGTAVVTASVLNTAVTAPTSTGSGGFAPLTVWVRSSDGGRPARLTVIGVVDPRSQLDPGIYTSRATAAALGVPLPEPSTFLFAVGPGTRERDAIAGLQLAFADGGVTVTGLDQRVQIARSIRELMTQLVQGFMGLGLIAGVAALGMLGIQSVVERRAELGTLRALGFTRWQVRASLALESSAIAVTGVGVGVGLGLVLARSLTGLLAQDYPEIQFVVPWARIGLTVALAWGGSALSVAAAVWQAGRVSPAEALRAI